MKFISIKIFIKGCELNKYKSLKEIINFAHKTDFSNIYKTVPFM